MIKSAIGKIRFKDRLNRLKGRSLSDIIGLVGLRLGSAILIYATNLLLTNVLGVEGYGTYMYTLAWVNILSIPAGLGSDKLLRREIAVYEARSDWSALKGLIIWANSAVFFIALLLATIALPLLWQSGEMGSAAGMSPVRLTLCLAVLTLPLRVVNRVRTSTMQGFRRILPSQIPEMVIRPLLLIVLVAGSALLLKLEVDAPLVMGLNIVTFIVTLLIGTYLVNQTIPDQVKAAKPSFYVMEWFKGSLPMLIISAMYVIESRTDAVMLGTLQGTVAVGLYVVANRGSEIISYTLIAVNTAMASKFAGLYAKGNKKKLQQQVTKCTRLITAISFPLGIMLIVFGHWFLRLFGPEFTAARNVLTILCISNLINALVGSVSLLLTMSGHARHVSITISITAGLNVLLNALLIPRFGVEGAAIATATSTIVRNLVLERVVRQKIGVRTSVFG